MAYQFNGSTDRIDTSYTAGAGEPFSLSCWFKPDVLTSDMVPLSIGVAASSSNFHNIRLVNSASTLTVHAQTWNGSSLGDAAASASLSSTTWAHAGCVWTSGTSRAAYFNGGNKGTDTTSAALGSNPTRITCGVSADSTPALWYDGAIAEAGVWDVALTDAEMAMLGAGVSPIFVRPANLIYYMPLVRDAIELTGVAIPSVTGTTVTDHASIVYPANIIPFPYTAAVAASSSNLTLLGVG